MKCKKLKLKTLNSGYYSYMPYSGLIYNEDGLNNASEKRIEMLEQLEASFENERTVKTLDVNEVEHLMRTSGFNELIIEVTTNCNLRCKYCIFGESYKELRKHDVKKMPFDIAKKSIDMYFKEFYKSKKHNPNRTPIISFYGGEPLMNFSLIKECTNYIKNNYPDENIFYTMTTNATLMDENIMDFFVENDFYPLFSLDGDMKEHNANRIFSNGNGSFETAFNNMKKFYKKRKFPLFTNVVYTVDTDLNAVIDFFSQHEEFVCINITPVSPVNTTYYENFTKEQYDIHNKILNDLKMEYFNFIKTGKESIKNGYQKRRMNLLDLMFSRGCTYIIMRSILGNAQSALQYTSTCIPGERLFVDVDGYIYPCEKISRSKNIGNVQNGLDFEIITQYVNDYQNNILLKCNKCNIGHLCTACFNTFLSEGIFLKDESICLRQQEQAKNNLTMYCYINELNSEWLNQFRMEYYSKIKEMAVTLG